MIILQILVGWMLLSVLLTAFLGAVFSLRDDAHDMAEALETHPYR